MKILESFTSSLNASIAALPSEETLVPPPNCLTLLNTKNELLLSYLQHTAFLLLFKLRNLPQRQRGQESEKLIHQDEGSVEQKEIIKGLVELRTYIEKGVRPLETRLRYQIEKVVRAADDAVRVAAQRDIQNKEQAQRATDTYDSAEESLATGSNSSGDDLSSHNGDEIDELSYRPNPSAFIRSENSSKVSKSDKIATKDGIYKPPKITPTTLPEFRTEARDKSRRPAKSAALDEFIMSEMSNAPMMEPSIGSTIVSGGRRMKSQKERTDEAERRAYEETNLVRLPKPGKKERAKAGGRQRDTFGGEDWRELGSGLDRISRLTERKSGSGGVLERSRKRAFDDNSHGDIRFGREFEKKRKMHTKRRK
jgi:U3 small nucleolar ribonucleoprotein protein LCP5